MAHAAGICLAVLAVVLTISRVWSFTDGDLRLAGVGASPLLGRLEVYYNGNWGSVCGGEGTTSGNFNLDSAHAACRQMGLGFAVNYFSALNLPEYRLQYGLGSGPNFYDYVSCQSNSHLLQCTFHIGPNSCDHSLDVVLQCSNISSYYNGEVRLVPDPSTPILDRTSSSGRVELFSNGQWKGVCLDGTNSSTGDLLCRQLGYTEMDRMDFVTGQVITDVWQTNPSPLLCQPGNVCIASCLSELPVTMATTACSAMTLSCKFNVSHFFNDELFGKRAICQRPTMPILEGGIRLVNDANDDDKFGRLEVFLGGVWGTVCGHHFGIREADVACTQLGFPIALRRGAVQNNDYYGGLMPGNGFIHNLGQCRGVEGHLTECSGTVSNKMCSNSSEDHLLDVALTCSSFIQPYGSLFLRGRKGMVTGASGTLLMFTGQVFETICDANFETEHAVVACRQLGYSSGVVLRNSYFGDNGLTSKILRLTGSCLGSESQLLECPPSQRLPVVQVMVGESNECRPGIDEVAIQCVSDEIELRLVGGPSLNSGQLEVKYDGSWGHICGSGFSRNEALVVCRSLDYSSVLSVQVDTTSLEVGSQPVQFSNLSCSGYEESLLHCRFFLEEMTPCTAPDASIWIECGSKPLPQDGKLRLVDGELNTNNQSGRLEVSYNGKWRSICGKFFSETAAEVACRDLGYSNLSDFCTDACFGPSEKEVLFVEEMCKGSELRWKDCLVEIHHSNTCNHTRDVGLTCVGRISSTTISSNLPPSATWYMYVICAAVVVTFLVLIVVCSVCGWCCCMKWRKKNTRGTWINQSRTGSATQNGHTHHNVAVSDIPSKMASIKEEGFDDPKDVLNELEMAAHSFSHYSSPVAPPPATLHHHDMHALSHSQNDEEEQKDYPSDQSVNHHIQSTNEFHRGNGGIIGNGIAVAMVHGIGTEQRSSIPSNNARAGSRISFTCPLPNYNEIYQSSSAMTVSNSYVNNCLGDSSTAWYEDHGGSSDSEEVKQVMKNEYEEMKRK